jgi:heat shock protein HslJ
MNRLSILAIAAAAFAVTACSTTGSGTPPGGIATPAALQSGEWTVEDIGGRGIVDNSHATLLFGPDGQLAGSATCNRLIATYAVKGAALTISPGGLTMMACPPALMEQERRFVDLLKDVKRYQIDRTGALVLETAAGKTITARR